jgi:hypothetical protein
VRLFAKLGPVLALTLAIGVVLFRMKQANPCLYICRNEGKILLNDQAFLAEYSKIAHEVHSGQLAVLVDPEHDCPSSLFETPYWLKSAQSQNLKLTVLIPDSISIEVLESYVEKFRIPWECVIVLPIEERMVRFRRFGLIKVLIQDSRVKWFELGSEMADDFETLENRIRKAS